MKLVLDPLSPSGVSVANDPVTIINGGGETYDPTTDTIHLLKAGDTMTGQLLYNYRGPDIAATTTQTLSSSGVQFVGTGQGIVTTNATMNAATTLTVMGWFRMDPSTTSSGMIMTKWTGPTSTDNTAKFQLFRAGSNAGITLRLGTGVSSSNFNGTASVFDNTWHHIAVVLDNVNARVYIDGVSDVNQPFSSLQTGGGNFGIMVRENSGFNARGYADEVRWYTSALSQAQVQAEYAAGAGRAGQSGDANLLFGFHLNEGTGTTANDYSPNGYTMALTNATWSDGKITTSVSINYNLAAVTSADGVVANERGIISLGDGSGTTRLVGKNINFIPNGFTNALGFSMDGQVGIGTAVPTAQLTASTANVNSNILAINGGASGTTQQWYVRNDGTFVSLGNIAFINQTGSAILQLNNQVTIPNGSLVISNSGVMVAGGATGTSGVYTTGYGSNVPINNTSLIVGTSSASSVKTTIQGSASQSADLTQWKNSSGTILTAFQADGKLVFGPSGSQDTNLYRSAANVLATDDDVSLKTAGKGIQIKEGSNARMGTATLVGGTVTVNNTSVTANTRIFLTVQSLGTVTVPTAIAVTARTAATSFTITSADATDTSVVAYQLIEPS